MALIRSFVAANEAWSHELEPVVAPQIANTNKRRYQTASRFRLARVTRSESEDTSNTCWSGKPFSGSVKATLDH